MILNKHYNKKNVASDKQNPSLEMLGSSSLIFNQKKHDSKDDRRIVSGSIFGWVGRSLVSESLLGLQDWLLGLQDRLLDLQVRIDRWVFRIYWWVFMIDQLQEWVSLQSFIVDLDPRFAKCVIHLSPRDDTYGWPSNFDKFFCSLQPYFDLHFFLSSAKTKPGLDLWSLLNKIMT